MENNSILNKFVEFSAVDDDSKEDIRLPVIPYERKKLKSKGVTFSQPVIAKNKDGIVAHSFTSMHDAEVHGYSKYGIKQCLNGMTLTYKGFSWFLLESEEMDKSSATVANQEPVIRADKSDMHKSADKQESRMSNLISDEITQDCEMESPLMKKLRSSCEFEHKMLPSGTHQVNLKFTLENSHDYFSSEVLNAVMAIVIKINKGI